MELITPRLTLAPNGLRFLASTHRYAADPVHTRFMMNLPNNTVEETRAFLEAAEREWAKPEPEFYEFAILRNGAHIGAMSAYLDDARRSAEIGWIIAPEHTGQGYAFEAALALWRFLTDALGCERIIAHCDAENAASERLMRKLGMQKMSLSGGRYNKGCAQERQELRYEWSLEAAFMPLLSRIDELLAQRAHTSVAIDGRCASGKSTLGALLRQRYGCRLLHMDDFFVPFVRKTPERLAEPGGNVDYERFANEVLSVGWEQPLPYRRFDCVAQALEAPVLLPPNRLTVVEGSYSLHRALREAYDIKVFLSLSPKAQSARILARNGKEKHKRFIEEWIPLEERYFEAEKIADYCDLRFEEAEDA
ncbi:MAG: GNAT family N-acetyltransferase [Clostridia bacterium]|nr:GNAT family N-acetyltransferase [Clostridia bacterium]